MAATLIGEKVASRSSIDDGFTRTYTRVFLVRVTSKNDRENTATLATGVPSVGDAYAAGGDSDTGALCVSVSAQVSSDNPYLYEVTCEYSSQIREQSQQAEDPIARPAKVSWNFQPYTKPVNRDILGKTILNSAKLPFDPPIEADDRRVTLSISRNEATFDAGLAYDFQDATNSDPFFGGGIAAWKVQGIKADGPHSENGTSFWAVTYDFEFRREGWYVRAMDAGYSELVSGTLVEIKNGGERVSVPEPLDGVGRRLSRAKSILSAAIDATQVGVTVDDGDVFQLPAGLLFPNKELVVGVDDEEMYVASNIGGLLTVTRGYNGTEAAEHAEDAEVRQLPVYLAIAVYAPMPFAMLALP
jgi:hypothetical protein